MDGSKMIRLLFLTLSLLFISSCATLSEKDCKNGNWKAIGLRDGSNGLPKSRLEAHQKACSDYGVTIDSSLYFAGRTEGLKRYCQPENGYRMGETGKHYHNVCTSKKFYENYRLGKKVYGLKQESYKLDRKIVELESQINDLSLTKDERLRLEGEMRANQSRLNSLNINLARTQDQAERLRILEEINQLQMRNTEINSKIAQIDTHLNRTNSLKIEISSLKSKKSKIDKKIMMLKVYAGRNPVEFIDLL
jgi:hypothetical protein